MERAESMNKKFKAKWVEALRSGRYKQGDGMLRTKGPENKALYCCLGVACRVLGLRPNKVGNFPDDSGSGDYAGDEFPTPSQLKKLGLSKLSARSLARLNDDGNSFDDIAKVIEKRY